MKHFILDTNIFFNMEAGLGLGKKTEEVVVNLTSYIKRLSKNKTAEFYMSPLTVVEFLSFFPSDKDKNQPFIKDLLSSIVIKSPDQSKIDISSTVFYQLIEDIRLRSYRGMTVAEEEMSKVASGFMDKKTNDKKDFQITIGKYINSFRSRYRQATRVGFLDSLADLDTIMLAKEINGEIVTTDEGVIKWGRVFGVKEILASTFIEVLKSLDHHQA